MGDRFREGDRVEWVGEPLDSAGAWPQRDERGWLIMIHPMNDIVEWDDCGTLAGDFTRGDPMVRVGDRNEPDPAKRLPYDPYGRLQERRMSSLTRRLLFYFVVAIAIGLLWYAYEFAKGLRDFTF